MNGARKTAISITLAIQIFGAAAIVSARNVGPDGNASDVEVRDYEAAKTTPQPINLWKVKEYGCGGEFVEQVFSRYPSLRTEGEV